MKPHGIGAHGELVDEVQAFAFPRGRFLKKREQFLECYNRGVRYFSRTFILFVLPGRRKTGFLLGTAVSKKIGKAVQRNRVKRLIREFFRLHQHRLTAGVDIVVVPKRRIDPDGLTYRQVEMELAPVLRKIQNDWAD